MQKIEATTTKEMLVTTENAMDIKDTLDKQLALVDEILKLERQKRRAILSVNGNDLQELTRNSEKCSLELAQLEKLFLKAIANISNNADVNAKADLKRQIAAAFPGNDKKDKKMKQAFATYETKLLALRKAVIANQQLLQQANESVHNILCDLQGDWKKRQKAERASTYSPRTSHPTDTGCEPTGLGEFLNENA